MPPSRVGPYVIERKIGSGGMGTVYYARHAETDEAAAVKVLSASLAREEGFLARFAREIDALKKLINPHVVTLYESGMDGENYFYAMEYVEGETLSSRLRRERRVPWREVVEIALQICSALKAAHDAGIIHRDLKPSNLLIDAEGSVKLTDFGVAQVFAASRLTKTGGVIGTVEYMSPEQAQGHRATKKSDLYSLGATMYVMLTGRPPFSGETALEVMHKHRYAQFDRPQRAVPEIPRWLDEIVCQLLEKDPDQRFPDAFVLFRRLQQVLKKVQLAESESERTVAAENAYDGSASTVMLEEGIGSPEEHTLTGEATGQAIERGPGAGTLMRDFMKAEVRKEQRSHPLAALLDSTWVLVGLLGLLIGGGVWWSRARQMTPQERFEAGVELMNAPEGPDWLRAREEYFQPLLEGNPDRWSNDIRPYLDRIRRYEWESDFQARQRRGRQLTPQNDIERFLLQAQHQIETGRLAGAEQTLSALAVLLNDTEEHKRYRRLTKQLGEKLQAMKTGLPNQETLLAEAMARAQKLSDEGNWEQACRIWQSIIQLYGDNPAARDQVQRARELLRNSPGNATQ